MEVRPVWRYNLEEELALIRQFATWCPYITIDTEFPGVIYEAPTHPRHMSPEERYAFLKKNVDCLKLIQLGLTLSTTDGEDRSCIVWEFNFQFDPLQDAHSSSSIKLLKLQGHNLWMNYFHGVDPRRFAALIWSSGLLCNQSKTWIGFHMSYDIGVYDIKHLCKLCWLGGGLEQVAGALNVERAAGHSHHAGSDSLLAWDTFRRLKATLFMGDITPRVAGILFGIHDN
ncbi:CCR4-NOT transcription complex subunit 7 [Rhynchospora pubera]|uniref:poly(A)-specific ribonuclease n=1 Tax=Rhynchospora pubera TaxID=906938 RepID=A0AAV8H8L4_9POAL|nr:CCR4-NOT transcription complex subunit 7 [Rhynchospora pubera]KAJ4814160.1 CCR4-NOT transcription complex subunit 7 [Rhynchospora pubera]